MGNFGACLTCRRLHRRNDTHASGAAHQRNSGQGVWPRVQGPRNTHSKCGPRQPAHRPGRSCDRCACSARCLRRAVDPLRSCMWVCLGWVVAGAGHSVCVCMFAGIFAGWASVGESPEVYKTACSIGYNPGKASLPSWYIHGKNLATHNAPSIIAYIPQGVRHLQCLATARRRVSPGSCTTLAQALTSAAKQFAWSFAAILDPRWAWQGVQHSWGVRSQVSSWGRSRRWAGRAAPPARVPWSAGIQLGSQTPFCLMSWSDCCLQANFPSLQTLINRIHKDGEVAAAALDHPTYQQLKTSPLLLPSRSLGPTEATAS
jgi:hypothetical protein